MKSQKSKTKAKEKKEIYLFSRDKIPGKGSGRLIEFLKQNFGFLSLSLNDKKTKANLKIDDNRTDEVIVKTENGEVNIYKEHNEGDEKEYKTRWWNPKSLFNKHKKSIFTFLLGSVFVIIITPYISPTLATIFPSIDKEPPEIIGVTPLTNSNLFDISNISVSVSDGGGSGLDLKNSFIILSGEYSGHINVTEESKDNVLIITPIEKLKPDTYTAEFFIRDRGGNLKKDFVRFTLFERPKFRFDLFQIPHLYLENDDVYGNQWKERYIVYIFGIQNVGSTVTLADLELILDFPGVILNYVIVDESSCVNCNIREGKSNYTIVHNGKTEKNFSKCQLVIEIERLSPGGILDGQIFIDPQYTPKPNEVITDCVGEKKYEGHYFYEQLGWVHRVDIEGEINMNRDDWINKGIYLRNIGLKYNSPVDVKESLDAFDNAINIEKNDSVAWDEKGISLAYLGNFSGAIQSFNRSISINPNFEMPNYHIALIFFKLMNCNITRNYAQKALNLKPDFYNAGELISSCERQNIVYPGKIKNGDLNENEGTFVFNYTKGKSFDKSPDEVGIFNFPVRSSRFILKKDKDFNLVFEHISIQTGLRVARINLSSFKGCDKLSIGLSWSKKENILVLACSDEINKSLISEKAKQIDSENILIKNFLEIQPFLEITQ